MQSGQLPSLSVTKCNLNVNIHNLQELYWLDRNEPNSSMEYVFFLPSVLTLAGDVRIKHNPVISKFKLAAEDSTT